MTKEQLNVELKNIEKEFHIKKEIIIRKFCDENNPYKVGDKFTDHIGSIIIEKIGYYYSESGYGCAYFGIELKKDGSPKKNNSKRRAHQSNDIKKLDI